GVRVPERVALVVEAAPLVREDVPFAVEIARVEQLRMVETGLAEEVRRQLELAEQAAEGNVGLVREPGAAEDADSVPRHGTPDLGEGGRIDRAREVDAVDLADETRSQLGEAEAQARGG